MAWRLIGLCMWMLPRKRRSWNSRLSFSCSSETINDWALLPHHEQCGDASRNTNRCEHIGAEILGDCERLMSFRVMARTVIQLGAELISSDGIAFYELIKNAFDAGSPRVDIDVLIRLPYDAYISHVHFVQAEQKVRRSSSEVDEKVAGRRAVIVQDLDPTAPGTTELAKRISRATTWEQLLEELDKANRIDFGDFGSGMTRKDLQENFLTIGTRSRLIQLEGQRKKGESRSPILGEKGLGRLS